MSDQGTDDMHDQNGKLDQHDQHDQIDKLDMKNPRASSASRSCQDCAHAAAKESRRGFLFAAGTTLLTIGGALVAVPIVGAALAPAANRNPSKWIPLGKLVDFKVGDTVLVTFTNPWGTPDDGDTRENACYVRCLEAGKFQVFAVNCAHLGCPVEWFEQSRLFMCPCHGGVYYEDGSRASGPPPRGLFEYQWRIADENLEIFAGRLPGLQEDA